MNRKTIMIGFGVLVIVVFMMGALSPLMYVRSDSTQPTPAAEAEFEGAGEGSAIVEALKSELFISCNASNAAETIQAVEGVELAFKQTQDGYAALINENASIPEIYTALEGECDAVILRAAQLSFNGKIVLNSMTGNGTRDLHPINLEKGTSFVSGYGVQEGDEISVVVYAQLQGDQVTRLIIEQKADGVIIPSAEPANETFYNQSSANNTLNESSENATQ